MADKNSDYMKMYKSSDKLAILTAIMCNAWNFYLL